MQIESQGNLKPFVHDRYEPVLTSEFIEGVAMTIISGNQRVAGGFEGAWLVRLRLHPWANKCRFRVNTFIQNGNFAMVLRHLRPLIPTFDTLNLGASFHEIIKEKTGIIFVTGGTGTGKTTTMAAMLNEINKTREIHVLTLEDPIEFVLTPIKSTFSQRELGRDFYSFHRGMRAAMRQAPKIIFIGDIRDRETMEIVLNAGETGTSGVQHAAYHRRRRDHQPHPWTVRHGRGTTGARTAGGFHALHHQPAPCACDQRRAIVVTEMMGSNLRTREAILLGESEGRRLDDIIEAGSVNGWHSF